MHAIIIDMTGPALMIQRRLLDETEADISTYGCKDGHAVNGHSALSKYSTSAFPNTFLAEKRECKGSWPSTAAAIKCATS